MLMHFKENAQLVTSLTRLKDNMKLYIDVYIDYASKIKYKFFLEQFMSSGFQIVVSAYKFATILSKYNDYYHKGSVSSWKAINSSRMFMLVKITK